MKNCLTRLVLFSLTVCLTAVAASAQVTTGSLGGKVQNSTQEGVAGASIIAIHLPSGTTYETTSRADGRFQVINMRVGGPYSVTVAYTGTGTAAFAPETVENVEINLGVATDLNVEVKPIAVTETVTVTAQSDTVFSSGRTGAATSVNRETLASMPTVRGLISDFTRLTPQTSGTNSFGGADNRMNNMTVNGAAFNNSFGLGGQPGERTGVAPISLEAIEQVQVSIAPYDVRQGNFVGASVDTITRSGTNSLRASTYYRFRNESFVGTEARGLRLQPRHVQHRQHRRVGRRAQSSRTACSCSATSRTNRTRARSAIFRANNGGEPVGGNITRVLASDLAEPQQRSSRPTSTTTPASFDPPTDNTPQKRGMIRTDLNINAEPQVQLQLPAAQLELRQHPVGFDLGRHRPPQRQHRLHELPGLQLRHPREPQDDHRRVELGVRQHDVEQPARHLLVERREPPAERRAVPVRRHPARRQRLHLVRQRAVHAEQRAALQLVRSEERLHQVHDASTSSRAACRVERYHSDNVFYNCCKQGSWVYNSLEDFYTDARDALANPEPHRLRR